MRTTNRFQRGTGCYTCSICGHKTRSTGRGDNEHVGQCAQCYDWTCLENNHSDNHDSVVIDANCPICKGLTQEQYFKK